MEGKSAVPLSIAMESTREKLNQAFNKIISESRLPAYLIEGMILEILSETRNRKSLELVSDIGNIKNENNTKEE